ncbi:hypothetical protein [Desulfovibrio sp. An276]|uniref:hypothetical protein n=1 Tax=Desulfovibrio sp. An276 TaxID=1965618 RepID=UPI001185783E|nr:hypothetical protein [Desulfovibrio sp. An276]
MTLVSARITVSNDLILFFLLAVRRSFLQIFVKAPAREWQIEGLLRVKKKHDYPIIIVCRVQRKNFCRSRENPVTESGMQQGRGPIGWRSGFLHFLDKGRGGGYKASSLAHPVGGLHNP